MTTKPCIPRDGLEVRHATASDTEGLVSLWQDLMALHRQPDGIFALAPDACATWSRNVRDLMERDDSFVLVASDRRHGLLGFCSGWVAKNPDIYAIKDVGFLCDMVVHSSFRRLGVGRSLIDATRAWFARRALEEFQLSSAVWNEDAHQFWQALGGEPMLMRFRFVLDEEVWPCGALPPPQGTLQRPHPSRLEAS